MRNFRKVIALVLAVAMMLTTFTTSFAAEKTSADKLYDLGLLSGITASELGATLTRDKGIAMVLKALGFTQEKADAYVPTATIPFTDTTNWVKGFAAKAFDMGITTGKTATTFAPSAVMTQKEFVTFMLRALGYDKTAAWTDTEALAKTAGLSELLNDTTFTKADAADVMFKALSAKTTGGTGAALYTTLGLDQAKLVAAGLAPAETVKVNEVVGVTNKIVDLKVKDDDALKAAPSASAFTIKDAAGAALEVTGVELMNSGKTVRVKTAQQTAGTLYTLTVDASTVHFTGLAADTTKPAVVTVVAKSNTSVEVTFEKDDTDPVAANYTINDLTVTAASVDGTKVTLTTSAQTSGKLYTLTMDGVMDLSGNKMDKKEVKFGGKAADTTKPVVSTAVATSNTTVKVTFTEGEKMGDSALDIANYSINDLTITKAEFIKDGAGKKNEVGADPVVELTTSAQTSGKLYTLTVQNVKDLAGNTADKKDVKFGGMGADTTKPAVASVVAKTNTTVEVTYTETGKLGDSALDIANYALTDLTITKAEFVKDSNVLSGTPKVTLTTSAQTSGKLYTLTVQNVKDVAGNTIDKKDVKFGGMAADTTKPQLTAAQALSQTSVKLTFDSELDEASAEDVANYSFDGSLYYPVAAVYDNATKTVTLTTLAQAAKSYKVTVINVKDLSGNVIDSDKDEKTFSGIGAALDKLKVEAAIALDKNTIKVIFNQAVKENGNAAGSALNEAYYTISGTGALQGDTATDTAYTVDDGKAVILTFADSMTGTDILKVAVNAAVLGKYGAAIDTDKDEADFAGLGTDPAKISLDLITVVDKRTIVLEFSDKVKSTAGVVEASFAFFLAEADIDGGAAAFTGDNATAATIKDNKVTIKTTADVLEGKVYYVDILPGHLITNLAGTNNIKVDDADDKAELVFATGAVPTIELKVEAAVMTDVNTLEVFFNNEIQADNFDLATDVKIGTQVPAGGFTKFVIDGKKLTLYFPQDADLVSSQVFTVEFLNTTNSLAYKYDNALDIKSGSEKADFGAVTTANEQPSMTGASVIGDAVMKVDLSETITAAGAIDSADFAVVNKATGITLATTDYTVLYADAADKFFTITLNSGKFASGTEYEVYAVTGTDVKDASTLVAIKKDANDGGDRENSVKATGIATVAALTLVDAQVTLDFTEDGAGGAGTQDTIAATTTFGLVASTKYLFVLEGTTAATATSVYGTTAVDKSLALVQFGTAGASTAGIAGETLKVKVYDCAGNLLGTTGNKTTL